MKLSHIKKEHIEKAIWHIEKNINAIASLRSIYWIHVGVKKYPFKYVVRIAHQQISGNEHEWLKFNSKKEFRDYIENLGFKISTEIKTIDFFNSTDLTNLSDIGGLTYDKTSLHHKLLADDLKKNVWSKTVYWFKLVTDELEGFTGECKKVWGQRAWDNKKRVSSFKKYTWARIYRETDLKKDIYFTIGVDGNNKALVYKLDYQFEGKTVLTEEQKELCRQMIKNSPAGWKEIKLSELANYNWDKLVEETLDFINSYTALYDKTVEDVWSLNQKRIARLAFNTHGWVMPSGRYGKSTHPDTHEARYGYGHEEWLFDTSKLIDGFHYAFLEPIRKQQAAFIGKKYDVWLYTIDNISKKRYWIGEISNVEVLDNEQAEIIREEYVLRNWMKEMEIQILASGANPEGFSNWKGVDLFNIRFAPDDAKLNDPYYELPIENAINEQSRYAFAFFKEEFKVDEETEPYFNFQPPNASNNSSRNTCDKSTRYHREPKTIEISYLHKAISDDLTIVLRNQYGFNNVRPEHPAGYGANRIDIVVNDINGLIFYEIKTYPNLKTSIREALGQLIEYTTWTNQSKAKELIIITQPCSIFELKKAKIYISHLRSVYKIPIYHQTFDIETKQLSEKI